MEWYQWLSIAALAYCTLAFIYRFIRLITMGVPKDLSQKSGNVANAVIYAYTAAMSPNNKESAYLHLPTFTLGIFFHLGTFLAIGIFFWLIIDSFLGIGTPQIITHLLCAACLITSLCGFAILIKRGAKKELRELSGFDDYFSNSITSLVQLFTALYFLFPQLAVTYYILVALLFLWMPTGKTKHVLYFFFARYHLGFFYGWRGTWPVKHA